MDEIQIEQLEDVDIRYSYEQLEDEDYEFEFAVDDQEYDEVIKELKAEVSEDEEFITKIDCPHEDCRKSFSRQHNLIKHIKSHQMGLENKAGSVCHICGKTIKGVLSLHMRTHTDVKQFKCDDCGREFRQKVALNNHVLIHRNEKPYECAVCMKRFRQKYTMQHHMKNRHTGVKEHICELCGKEFSDKATLSKHSLVHSTNKPHQCNVCFMSFRHKSSLSRHTKIHKKVTQCDYCYRSFRYESFLKKHIQVAHSTTYTVEFIKDEEETKENFSSIVEVETPVFRVVGDQNYHEPRSTVATHNTNESFTS